MAKKIILTEEEFKKIKTLYSEGMTIKNLAKEMGYNRGTIRKMIKENKLERKKLTTEEIKVIKKFSNQVIELYTLKRLSIRKISELLEVNTFKVVKVLRERGIKIRGKNELSSLNLDENEIRNLYINQGMTMKEVAKKCNCGITTISSFCKKRGITKRRKTRINVPIELIIEMYKKGYDCTKIAKSLGCSPSTIKEKLQILGLIRVDYKSSKIDIEKLKELCEQGKSIKELMAYFHCSRRTIDRSLNYSKTSLRKYALEKVPYEELYRKLIIEDRTRKDVAKDYGVSESTLGLKLKEVGISIINERDKKYSEMTKELLEDMYYNQGLFQTEIAKKLRVGREIIIKKFKEYGIKKHFKFDNLTYEVLKEYYVDRNMPPCLIAKELGCPPNPIRRKVVDWGLKDLKTKEEQAKCKAKAYSYSLSQFRSKGEMSIAELFPTQYHNISTIINLELDLWYPEKNVAIEYNGDYWHSTRFGRNAGLHLAKLAICEERGIYLINIFERDWLSRCGKKIRAHLERVLAPEKVKKVEGEIKGVLRNDQLSFEQKWNFHDYDKSEYCLGTFKDGKLLNSMSYNIEEGKCQILRYTTEKGYEENYSELIKEIKKRHDLPIILTYDKRYYNKDFAEKLGFTQVKDIEPELYYVKGRKALRREEASEEYLNNPKCNPVYDCGFSEWIIN